MQILCIIIWPLLFDISYFLISEVNKENKQSRKFYIIIASNISEKAGSGRGDELEHGYLCDWIVLDFYIKYNRLDYKVLLKLMRIYDKLVYQIVIKLESLSIDPESPLLFA